MWWIRLKVATQSHHKNNCCNCVVTRAVSAADSRCHSPADTADDIKDQTFLLTMMTDFCKKWIERRLTGSRRSEIRTVTEGEKKAKYFKLNLFLEYFALEKRFSEVSWEQTSDGGKKNLKLWHKRRFLSENQFPNDRIVQFEFVLIRSSVACALRHVILLWNFCTLLSAAVRQHSTLTERLFMIYDFCDKRKTLHGKSKITHAE